MGNYLPIITRGETPFFESDDMSHNIGGLQDKYELSQYEVGEVLFLKQQTIQKIEQKAIINFKQALKDKNIQIKDLLP
jgi:hypothetical protein